ncbi:hypothetical protein Bca52824_048598 [Brassica carinata]|uniref:Uncharacterized protein n=1 Tax=Brassica carinata TaxID=52824 RepID=A0A8X7RGZ1_BRACI|nr:hypothetical protein Bca52824_048598 [Brassica carinata]
MVIYKVASVKLCDRYQIFLHGLGILVMSYASGDESCYIAEKDGILSSLAKRSKSCDLVEIVFTESLD